MKRTMYVAAREFLATVTTKGFVFGILATPALLGLLMVVMPRYLTRVPPKMEGQVVIIDPTGRVAAGVTAYLAPERFAERREKTRQKVDAATPAALRREVASSPGASVAMQQSLDAALGSVPHLDVISLPAGGDLEAAKAPLALPLPDRGSRPETRLAVIVVAANAITPTDGSTTLGTYDLYVRDKIDDRLVDDLHAGLKEAIVGARLASAGVDPARVAALTTVTRQDTRTVTAQGVRTTNRELNFILPAAFMILLLVSVMTSGQYLLTSTVEEKSNRVVEVLLSAVSPMELMTGKILGQMVVGLLVLTLYSGLGIVALVSFATIGLLDPLMLVFLLIFFVLAYATFASLMAAVGAAVNEIREALGMMTPIMMLMMVPWILWVPISREPNSVLSTVLSFVPPFGNFVMLLRMSSAAPPPMWQPLAAIGIGAAGAYAAVWFAAKVFKVGLLMYGKPPTFGTLVKWARMA